MPYSHTLQDPVASLVSPFKQFLAEIDKVSFVGSEVPVNAKLVNFDIEGLTNSKLSVDPAS